MLNHQEVETNEFLIFELNTQLYALPVEVVEVVVRMVEVISMAGAPEFIRGVINFHGEVIPVIDLRRRFGMPIKEVNIYDHLIIMRVMNRCSALIVDSVKEVLVCKGTDIVPIDTVLPNMPHFAGVAKLPDGIILLNNPDVLFSFKEMQAFENILKQESYETNSE